MGENIEKQRSSRFALDIIGINAAKRVRTVGIVVLNCKMLKRNVTSDQEQSPVLISCLILFT